MPGTAPPRKNKTRANRTGIKEYQNLVANAPIGIFTATPEGRFHSMNPAMSGLYGYDTPRQMISSVTDIAEQLYAEPSDRLEYRRLMEMHGQVVNHECQMVRRDGSTFWASTNARAVKDKKGNIVFYQGFLTDITERKRAEEFLLRTQFGMDQAPDSILWVDDQGNIVYANNAACTSMGFSREELQGMKVFDIDPDFPIGGWEQHKKDLKRLGRIRFEGRHRTKDGRLFPVEVTSNYLEYKGCFFSIAFDRDITDRKEIEESIRESEAMIRDYAENSPIGIYLSDLQGNFIYGNRMSEEIIGYKREELIGKNFLELSILSENSLQKAVQLLQASAEGRPTGPDEIELIRKGGDPIPAEIITRVMQRKRQKIVLGFVRDISDRKRADEAMRQSEQRFRALVETSSDWVWEIDRSGFYTYVSPKAEDLLGYRPDEMIGKRPLDFFLPDEAVRLGPEFIKIVEAQRPFSGLENVNVHKDGRQIVLETSGVPIFDGKGAFSGYRGIDRDITERKLAEEEIRKLSRMQSVILENSTVGIALVRNRVFEWVNPRMPELFGIPMEQLLESSTRSLYPSDEVYKRLDAEALPLLSQGKKATVEMEMCRGDGSLFWCRLQGKALDSSKPYEGVIWIAEDITDRKRAEEAIHKRIVALTQPLEGGKIAFEDLFNLDEIQHLQDDFANATGVASLITRPDGTPITAPSNFTYLCSEFVRKTEKGRLKCAVSDAKIGTSSDGPVVQSCLSAGLGNAGASIRVGGHHIANWLIGQVRDGTQTEESLRAYARDIGADEASFIRAFHEVPVMPKEKFEQIAQALFTLASQLSIIAYQNVQQARFIAERKQAEGALEESERKYRFLAENMPDIVWVMDMNLHATYVSPSIKAILGFTHEERMALELKDQLTPASMSSAMDILTRELALEQQGQADPHKKITFELEYYHRDGSTRWLESLVSGLRNDQGVLIGLQGVSRDVTRRKKAEAALRESEIRYRSIFENTGTAMLIIEEDMTISLVNTEFEKMTGYGFQDINGRKWPEFVEKSDMNRMVHQHHLRRGADAHLAQKRYEFRLVHRDGHLLDVYLIADIIPGTKQTVASCVDISDRKRMEEALKESEIKYRNLSIIDNLTQLNNSRHFYDQLWMEIDRVNRYDLPMSLILFDIDNFKAFNDTYGHVEGDRVLVRLGQVIKRCLRKTDSAYRYGGEEFTVLLPMTKSEEGIIMAERIRAEFKKEALSPVPDKEVHMAISMGLGQYHLREDMQAFVHRVDQLMYQAKKEGKDRVCYER